MWMKKRYVLNFDDNQHHTIVARRGGETQVQIDEGEAKPVNYWPVLGGKALSIRLGDRMHLVHISANGDQGQIIIPATVPGVVPTA